jgi:glyoxylate/hydroxypyruvate reductase A
MALLIDIKQPGWMEDQELLEDLFKVYPKGDIRCSAAPGNLDEISMLAVSNYVTGEALRYPNLKLVQKIGAGVESILADESLPEAIQVARLVTDTPAHEIAEYCLAAVLLEQRHFRLYNKNQSGWCWQATAPRKADESVVAVLGLGVIGAITAQRFIDNHFQVIGWSRSEKELPGVECYFGEDQLPTVLKLADYVVSILPSTPKTVNLFNHDNFSLMKPGSVIINCGRGDLIDEADLVEALDDGKLAAAILDVVRTEPLPVNSPLWLHSKVVLTPHVSGWHLGDAVNDIAENLRRLDCGKTPLHLVNRQLGY